MSTFDTAQHLFVDGLYEECIAALAKSEARSVRELLCATRAHLQLSQPHLALGCLKQASHRWFGCDCNAPCALDCAKDLTVTDKQIRAMKRLRTSVCGLLAKDTSSATFELKFPRTVHVANLGGTGVSRNDLVMDSADRQKWLVGRTLVVEEKIDGANLGLWIDEKWNIVAKNRSHMVCSESGTQWKRLQVWIDANKSSLLEILQAPHRYVLFGEWCVLQHSLDYSHLPGPFLAFDIFDVSQERFLSVGARNICLRGHPIPVVPLVTRLRFTSEEECLDKLTRLLDTKSEFRVDKFVEGLYVRVDDGESLSWRCKLVRPDFVQGITTHWSTMQPVKNATNHSLLGNYLVEYFQRADKLLGDIAQPDTEPDMTIHVEEVEATKTSAQEAPRKVTATSARLADPTVTNKSTTGNPGETTTTPQFPSKYPSTPHLDFSPGVQADDIVLSDQDGSRCLVAEEEIVMTEKLDGGNCCCKHGIVYARTHGSPASHWSFGVIKEMYQLWRALHPELMGRIALFGENMTAVHSIAYDGLHSNFYLFAIQDLGSGDWLSWDDVEHVAQLLEVPTVPLVFRGSLTSQAELKRIITDRMARPSSVGSATPEGVVIRKTRAFAVGEFARSIAKYVRRNHVQTSANWSKTCVKAAINRQVDA